MTVVLAGAMLGLAAAVLRRRNDGLIGVESLALALTVALLLVGLAAVGLASAGWFDATSMTIAVATLAVVVWPWGRRAPWPRVDAKGVAAGVLVVAAGLALRWPTADYTLAGRDQGTYTLRAQHTLRTGRIDLVDDVLVQASAEAATRPGPADILGLYPIRNDRWARDRYEGTYRPGLYLADRERGTITPQFFHLHPMWMATAGLLAGPAGVAAVIPLQAALGLLAIWAVARRLWPRGPWAWLAVGLVVASPLAIWVQRTALTEVPAAMLTWTAVLAVLRDDTTDREVAALLLGAGAWLRGHGWLMAPILAAILWMVPTHAPRVRRAAAIYVAVVVAGVFVHAASTWPYLHDELGRQLPGDVHPAPVLMVLAATGGALVWVAVDELWGARRRDAGHLRHAPRWIVVGTFVVVAAWWFWRGSEATKPFARLDPIVPLLGPLWLATAAVGAIFVARIRLRGGSRDVWLVAIAASFVATMALYAQRNLPRVDLYYYGRYLLPEVLPLAALLATAAVAGIHRRLARWRERVAITVATLHAGLLGWTVAGPLVVHPITRIAEFQGADEMLDHLAARLPPGAVVIAGGEGWHHGHTFNQVGGAIALREGVTVLPYRTREAAYATLHELLVAGPAATGRPAPPTFLLLNEATKPYRRPGDSAGPIAGIDDLLWPPFVATRIDLVELYVDRLTPVGDALPTRVTRDGLRMGLLRIDVDPDAALERWDLAAGGGDVRITGANETHGPPCLRKTAKVRVELPDAGRAGPGPVSLVVVARPGTSAHNHFWHLEADGERLSSTIPKARDRDRDTLGPFVLDRRPKVITLVGAPKKVRQARCPRGGLAEIRLLGPERSALGHLAGTPGSIDAVTFAPTRDLGHPVQPARWVSARGLSRFRAGTRPVPEIHGLSMVLTPEVDLGLARQSMPDTHALDVIVTLASSHAGDGAAIEVGADGRPLVRSDVPADLGRAWQTSVTAVPRPGPTTSIDIRLDATEGASVDIRDIGLFSRNPPIEGRRAH